MSGKDAGMYMLFQVIGAIFRFRRSLGADFQFGCERNRRQCLPGRSFRNGRPTGRDCVYICVCMVVLGTTDAKKGAGNFAGLAIGLSLALDIWPASVIPVLRLIRLAV